MQPIAQLRILFAGILLLGEAFESNGESDICHFPKRYNYPCEVHSIETADGYVLSAARIPYSNHGAKKAKDGKRPVVFIMHGIIWSSDCWLINGPDVGLAYMLADAGYDVWLGNSRGNSYGKKHISLPISSAAFWDFTFHEIGIYDLPATIDYILSATNQRNLHYVGHSQGTTVFLVWLSTLPQDIEKIKTSHLMAPVGFLDHVTAPLDIFGAIFGHPNELTNQIGAIEFGGRSELFDSLPQICSEGSSLQQFCEDVFFLITGYSDRFNRTLLPEVLTTYPAGSSMRQYIHFLQEFTSGYFRHFDYGKEKNIQVYSSETPPNYQVDLIKPSDAINLYYSDHDIVVSPIDVHRLAQIMGDTVELYHIESPNYNHLDYLMGFDVREVINDCVMSKIERYEGKPFKGNACCHLSSNRHCSG